MQVIRVFEDSRGYIWSATKGGLSKFDGEKFENFYRKDSLKFLKIDDITEDSKKNIWVQYTFRGYTKFDGKSFTNFIFSQANYSNIIEHKGRMLFMRNDSLYNLTNNKIVFDGSTCKPAYGGTSLCTDNNYLYLISNHSIYFLDEKNKKIKQLFEFSNSNQVERINKYYLVSLSKKVFFTGFSNQLRKC